MKAADLMTKDPRTIEVDESVGDAVDALVELDVRHLPVVSAQGELVGMISDRDLGGLHHRGLVPTIRVAEAMSGSPVSVDLDASVEDVVELLLEHRIGAVPVVDADDRVVGIVSYVDVLRALPQLLDEAAVGSPRGARARAARAR